MQYFQQNHKKSFTLLEMLIVMTIVAIILPTVFAIVFVIMRQQVRIYRVIETRRQGDYILSYMKDRIIRSKGIENTLGPVCDTSGFSFQTASADEGNDITLIDQNDAQYKFVQSGTNINFHDLSVVPNLVTPLNTSPVQIVADTFYIACFRRATYSSPLITISFDITYFDPTVTAQEGTVTIHYQTKVKLRE